MNILLCRLLVLIGQIFFITYAFCGVLTISTSPAYKTNASETKYIVTSINEIVAFTAFETHDNGNVDNWSWNFSNGNPSFSNEKGPVTTTFGSQAVGLANDCTVSAQHYDGLQQCSTPTMSLKVSVPSFVFNVEQQDPEVSNYIENSAHISNANNEAKIPIKTKLTVNTGVKSIAIASFATSLTPTSSYSFTPSSGSTEDDGTFVTTLKTNNANTTLKVKLTPDGFNQVESEDHKMLPAIFRATFKCTIYYTPNESGFAQTNMISAGGLPPARKFPMQFLDVVKVEGWGKISPETGGFEYIGWDTGSNKFIPSHNPTGNHGNVLQPKSSCAVDTEILRTRSAGSSVVQTLESSIQSTFSNNEWTAADVGEAIGGHDLDLYWGVANPRSQADVFKPAGTTYDTTYSKVILKSL